MVGSLTLCGICLLPMDLIIALPILPLTSNDMAFVRWVSWILLQPVNAPSSAYLAVPPCTAQMLTTLSSICAASALASCVLAGERVRMCTTVVTEVTPSPAIKVHAG